jgi:hypothetical protein
MYGSLPPVARAVCSTCRQVSWCGPSFQPAMTPRRFSSSSGKASSAVCAGEVGGTTVGQGKHHAGQQRAGCQLAAADGGRQQGLDRPADAGGGDDVLDDRQRGVHGAAAPSSVMACSSVPGSRPAAMSPNCWQQLMPAACRNAGRPISAAVWASHVARSLLVSSGGSPVPPPARRSAGQHRHRPRPGAADFHVSDVCDLLVKAALVRTTVSTARCSTSVPGTNWTCCR